MKGCQQKVLLCSERFFELWGGLVVNCGAVVAFLSLASMVYLITGVSEQEKFEDEQKAFFGETDYDMELAGVAKYGNAYRRTLSVIFEAKRESILTIDAFNEMLQFEDVLSTVKQYNEAESSWKSIEQICVRIKNIKLGRDVCVRSAKPLDFVYDAVTDTYDLSKFATDEHLVARI